MLGSHMLHASSAATVPAVLERPNLQRLLDAVSRRGYQIVAPTVRDGAIVYDAIAKVEELPIGWTDEQDGGRYRLRRRGDAAVFSFAVGPHSWKRLLHPPVLRLWRAHRDGAGFRVQQEPDNPPKQAFLGVRSCELHAISIQDRVFLQGEHVDAAYRRRRERTLLIAVNCGQPAQTCFCVSMNTGPRASGGYDLALTEVLQADRHDFLAEAGSEVGRDILAEIPTRPAGADDLAAADAVTRHAAAHMGRSLNTADIKELFYRTYEHPRWDDVAQRCLACANCTMVCPTCFCTTVEDVTDLTGEHAERWRKWDSCYTLDFTHLAGGGSVRQTIKSRYRQWLTHKLATWLDQFGTSGCVGCGRCITWCPVGIDLTEEVPALRQTVPLPLVAAGADNAHA